MFQGQAGRMEGLLCPHKHGGALWRGRRVGCQAVLWGLPVAPLILPVLQEKPGEGLLFYGNVILPFADKFPKDTELYRIMTTKPTETIKE